jgi:cellulose synthase/poly-beta-1,6-N-acetylglucosamine synthase-like glycosyltransferase
MEAQVFFIVLARDGSAVQRKTEELDRLGFAYVVACGEDIDRPNIVYRKPKGKYDAINHASKNIPKHARIIALNDVDTEIHNIDAALHLLKQENLALVFARVEVEFGPQMLFYSFLDALRTRIPIAASGELMLVRHDVLKEILPLQGCKAEDSLILFKVLERERKVAFCRDCYVTTKRTETAREEEDYKRRTVGGIYQALSMTRPPSSVRLFYELLPFASPLLLFSGKKGYYWMKGIVMGYVDYLRGDRTTTWKRTYS